MCRERAAENSTEPHAVLLFRAESSKDTRTQKQLPGCKSAQLGWALYVPKTQRGKKQLTWLGVIFETE